MPAWPSCHSGCQAQVSDFGSAGFSSHPLGVRMSTRPSPLTSPEPTPCPAAVLPRSCFFHSGFAPAFTSSYQTTTLVVLGRMSSLPSPLRSTIAAASLVPGRSIS